MDNNNAIQPEIFSSSSKMEKGDSDASSTQIEFNDIKKKVIPNPLWLSISESAKIGGVQNKTIRRAIQSKAIKYVIKGNRYSVDLASLIAYLHSKKKLMNKLKQFGIGQYIKEWE